MDDILDAIDRYFGHPKVDRHGERWPRCPFHDDRRSGSFSYNPRVFSCFACGAAGSLRQLAERLGILVESFSHRFAKAFRPAPRRPEPKPEPTLYAWQRDPEYWRRYLELPALARDYYAGRGFSADSIRRWRLGYGVLPASRCRIARAILPVFAHGRLVALRGRACHPDDADDKWLCAGGSQTVLFGLDDLAPGRTLIVTEAPYSAILALQARPEISAVAPTVSSHWEDGWTQAIAAASPRAILVWFDNDVHGRTYGARCADTLARAHLPVHVYEWSSAWPEKSDLADVVLSSRELAA